MNATDPGLRASTQIRRASPDEMPQVLAVIVAAFAIDPLARFAWPDVRDYLEAMPVAIRKFSGASFKHGTVYLSTDRAGTALWLPPGVEPASEATEKVFRDTASPERLGDVLATFEKMGQSHPTEAHWYLPMIGVDPMAQGKGLGGHLLRHSLARCDEDGALAYLETGNPRNLPLYERFGFEVTGEIQVGSAPVVWPMLRRPR